MKVTTKQEVLLRIKENSKKFEKYGVKQLGVFGSFVYKKQREESDVDLIVEFAKGEKNYQNFLGTASLAENVLGREVDLVTTQGISPHILPHIKRSIEYVQIT